ncbi:MAG: SDR family oxidoreductase [Micrococcales bacterium]|nr:SDR family oxidoreductase [Micrococcales bacterium]
MSKPKQVALISGISGQDGSYLAEYLLSLGYEVHGMIRRHSVAEDQSSRLKFFYDKIETFYGDLLDEHSIYRAMERIQPDVIYNLAAMSHVRISSDIPSFTIKTNSIGVLNMLEATRSIVPNAKFYQASSSEMFGNSIDSDGKQRLSTPMTPVSPYGCSKLLGYNLVRHYRNAYGMYAVNGILFNHESPRRGINFVTNKVVKHAVEIYRGKRDSLELGNLDSYRDWGHSYDYVRAMHAMMNYGEAREWIVATGETRSVRDMVNYVFDKLNLSFDKHVRVNPSYIRPEELKYLCGDASETKRILGWKPVYTFETMLDEMIEHWKMEIP